MPFYLYLLILIPLIAFSGWASAKVNSTFNAFDKVPNRACMTGYDAAVRLMRPGAVCYVFSHGTYLNMYRRVRFFKGIVPPIF